MYLLGTELDESFKEFGKNREVMGLCREGESSLPLEFLQALRKFLAGFARVGDLIPPNPLLIPVMILLSEEEEGGEPAERLENLVSGASCNGERPVMGSVPEPFTSRPNLVQHEVHCSVIRFGDQQ